MPLDRQNSRGFTLIELLTVIVVMSILLGGGWVVGDSYFAYINGSRDGERTSDVEGLARQFEQYYRVNSSTAITGSSYPTKDQVQSSLTSVLQGASTDITKAPDQTTSSVVVASTNSSTQSPPLDQYLYQPLNGNGDICTNTNLPCVRFVFYYRNEKTGTVTTLNSMRQQ